MTPRRFPPPWSVEELTSADAATARVYNCLVGPGTNALSLTGLRFDGPDEVSTSFGALRRSRRFSDIGWRLCCVARVLRESALWPVV
jgi:hypothetical protein